MMWHIEPALLICILFLLSSKTLNISDLIIVDFKRRMNYFNFYLKVGGMAEGRERERGILQGKKGGVGH